MAKKPRREEVQKLIKGLLDSELPEIQNVAKQLTDRIRQLEEHSLKLQNYVAQIENLAIEESDSLVDARIHELVTGLEKALGERRQKSQAPVAEQKPETKTGEGAEAQGKVRAEARPEAEQDEEIEERATKVKVKSYTTPDGLVVRKTRVR